MSTTTPNLGLFKYNTTTDSNVAFNINTALNGNWDKIDSAMAGGGLPDQTGKSGYLLTTNGSEASWGETRNVRCIIETFSQGTEWYRVYSDGWCEQGGTAYISALGTTISFIQPYISNEYQLALSANDTSGDPSIVVVAWRTKKADSFIIDVGYNGTFYASYIDWQASGYIGD